MSHSKINPGAKKDNSCASGLATNGARPELDSFGQDISPTRNSAIGLSITANDGHAVALAQTFSGSLRTLSIVFGLSQLIATEELFRT